MNLGVKLSNNNNWLLTPIIGEIKKNQENGYDVGVILDPKNKHYPITCEIRKNPNFIKKIKVIVDNDGPTKFILNVPEQGLYNIIWLQKQMENMNEVEIFEHNIKIKIEPDKIIFVSCDMLEADIDQEDSMWTIMNKEFTKPNDQICLIHVGDQAYMDHIFNEGIKMTMEHGQNEHIERLILNSFIQRYYETWGPHNDILASASNYNLWDDHELRNNMKLNDTNVSNEEIYVRNIAIKAYIKCQESLHVDKQTILSEYSWYKLMNDILILSVERNSRIIDTTEILNAIDTLTSQNNTKRLILCFSSAPIPFPQGKYGYLYRFFFRDFSKFWPSNDLSTLYKGIFNWLSQNKDREALLVGGDLHFGTYGVARYKNMSFPIVISSPITNQPTFDRWLASKGMAGTHFVTDDIGERITFHTVTSMPRRCYVVVNLNNHPMRISMNYSSKIFQMMY